VSSIEQQCNLIMASNGTNGANGTTPSRKIIVAGAQLGPIDMTTPRSDVLERCFKLMDEAKSKNVKLIVFPEIALTSFFPRHLIQDEDELETFFEQEVEGDPTKAPNMKPIFDKAREYGIDVSIGYAECADPTLTPHKHFNTAIYYSAKADKIVGKYRKVHLPGTFEPYERKDATNQLEKRYFAPGNLGFKAFRVPGLVENAATKSSGQEANSADTIGRGDPIVGMMICNDRRWAEAWRAYGLQGAELVLEGYNTTGWAPELLGTNPKNQTKEQVKEEAIFHHKLSVQHGSYTNACWSVNVAKCGLEDGKYPLIPGSCIVDPDGAIVVEAKTEDDELFVWECDLDLCKRGKGKVFAFERHRRTEAYGILVDQTGVKEPELL
jgi:predicted amidohydrolase